jgi:hypothetical protein
MRLLFAIGLAAFAYAYINHPNLASTLTGNGPMDGTVWDVNIRPNSWFSLSHRDTLVFDTGRLTAVNYLASGYASGSYSAAGQGGEYSWQSSFQRYGRESLSWTGHVQDNFVEGEIVQHDSSGRTHTLHFKGTRRLS